MLPGSVSATMSGFGAAVRTALGLTRRSRLRNQIHDTIDLYDKAAQHNRLAASAENLAAVVEIETNRLRDVASLPPRKREWGSIAVGIACTVIVALPGWFLWPHRSHWWAVVGLIMDGVVVLLFTVIVSMMFGSREP